MENERTFVSPAEVARELVVSKPTAYRLIYNKIIPSFKFGGCVRISRRDLEEFIAKSRR